MQDGRVAMTWSLVYDHVYETYGFSVYLVYATRHGRGCELMN